MVIVTKEDPKRIVKHPNGATFRVNHDLGSLILYSDARCFNLVAAYAPGSWSHVVVIYDDPK